MAARTVFQTLGGGVSNDGKTMTITTQGVLANGQLVHNVRVYDRQ